MGCHIVAVSLSGQITFVDSAQRRSAQLRHATELLAPFLPPVQCLIVRLLLKDSCSKPRSEVRKEEWIGAEILLVASRSCHWYLVAFPPKSSFAVNAVLTSSVS